MRERHTSVDRDRGFENFRDDQWPDEEEAGEEEFDDRFDDGGV